MEVSGAESGLGLYLFEHDFPRKRLAFVAKENRHPLFRIMLQRQISVSPAPVLVRNILAADRTRPARSALPWCVQRPPDDAGAGSARLPLQRERRLQLLSSYDLLVRVCRGA